MFINYAHLCILLSKDYSDKGFYNLSMLKRTEISWVPPIFYKRSVNLISAYSARLRLYYSPLLSPKNAQSWSLIRLSSGKMFLDEENQSWGYLKIQATNVLANCAILNEAWCRLFLLDVIIFLSESLLSRFWCRKTFRPCCCYF